MTQEHPTILIVEDEQELADLFAAWLDAEYDCRVAYDGESALEAVDESVDAMLLDRRMPGLSGDEVLEQLRAQGLDCPIGMVTAVEPTFDIVEMGFDDYIVKPVGAEELQSFVNNLLSLSGYDQNIRRFFQLSSKRSVLESTKNEQELAESEEYQTLVSELEQVREAADADRDAMAGTDSFSKLL